MTSPTVADLQAVLRMEAEDVAPAGDILARVLSRGHKTSRHRATLIAATVIVTLVVGIVVTVIRASTSPVGPHLPASPHLAWRTFSSPQFGFAVKYPPSWRAVSYEEDSTMSAAVVFLGDQPMTSPCKTSASGSNVVCGASVVAHLPPDGVSIDWSNHGAMFPNLFEVAAGTRTTIGGFAAKVIIRSDNQCQMVNGRTSVTATVQRPVGSNNVLVMHACINAARDSKQVALVISSLRTMRQS